MGPYPPVVERVAEIQPRDDDRIPERQERHPDQSRSAQEAWDVVRSYILGTRVMCQHSRSR